ncbi:carotenoid 1,2-hydratase [Pseudofrankia asymbiotica]|uniref:Carotenoid 1,2-hydratase n=1 Tax=Pseudofrankia asymbiotica TaxID=1834516 RepID=A0A1V2I2V3_9ACTN|nr:carotenoid 1,2-hydratase [Pseudofrankia asymbiotica]
MSSLGSRARRARFRKLAAAVLATVAGSLVLFTAGAPPASAITYHPVSLPADESPHVDAGMEWWYVTGHLSGKDLLGKSHSYGFETMINRNNGLSTAPALTIYNANFAIADLTRGTYKSTKEIYSLQPDVVPAGGGYNFTVGSVHMDGKNRVNHFSGGFPDLSYTFGNMTASQSTPAALHGDAGIIPYGPFGQSGYYSQTNLKVSGTLFDHGMPVQVTGTGWMDHQWGDWTSKRGGWEWYSIQLSNNTQYMLYFIRDANGNYVQTIGTLVQPNGSTTNLPPAQLGRATTGTWTSPNTNITYPIKSTVTVPGGTLSVTPQLPDQEVWSGLITVGQYWEGTATVSGTVNGQAVTGMAYAEVIPDIEMPGHGYVWQSVLDLLGL